MTPLLDSCRESLDGASRLDDVLVTVRGTARALGGAHGATFVLREGDRCYYADEDSIAPLWKGQRFPMTQCISGWAMLNRRSAVVPDISVDARIPQEAYRPTYVQSLAMVPIRWHDPVGAIGVYWARRHAVSDRELADLELLAQLAADALDRVGVSEAPWAPTFGEVDEPKPPEVPTQRRESPADAGYRQPTRDTSSVSALRPLPRAKS